MSLNELIPADRALEIVLDGVAPSKTIKKPIVECGYHTLAKDLVSLRTQPPFNASAMDGYAARSSDLQKIPTTLTLIGEAKAGTPFLGKLNSGEIVSIFTGGVVPDDADTIIIQENTEANGEAITILQSNVPGKFVRKAGLDFKTGDILLHKGDQLNPNALALAASMNHDELEVYKRPRLALIATGDELVKPGNNTKPGQIIASNTFGLHASAKNMGAEVLDLGIVNDTNQALGNAFENAIEQDCDVILTTGGASVGDHDLVMPVAKALGFEFEIAKIAMRPGKPFLFAKLHKNNRIIYLTGLAGNPVSSLIAYNVFVKPLISKLSGEKIDKIKPKAAKLGCDLVENDERMEYMRASLVKDYDGSFIATPFIKQDSSMLASLVKADCLVLRPANAKASPKGEACEIILLD